MPLFKKGTQVEWDHGHCADVLMDDYRISKEHRVVVCEEINKIYTQRSLIHCVIIASVRGFLPLLETDELKSFLETLQTRSPKNQKGNVR
ncbi:hypothetical protein COU16_01750 [Candidatus Kaiserbacteria bacterium CG10_big_fil_rev_8_21_14_0_10_47_16]|uniref:Uncharacterized protein n=1 Tax=Candidatus Kaiserbacteria bacterium CG10_big_fil_rev_8_21_14_0_10_47_16 TaxID=1974608 RepID=A0A2H0UD72_9BACT|nr:MAG: hypothetical protein COU16_01750 [Candidatus Kaiserbacteria bacterium CG10_big_fil_rev_8_21_14_0_10_47_16]